MQNTKSCRAPVSTDSVSAVHRDRKKIGKLYKLTFCKFQNARQARTDRNNVESQQPNHAQYVIHLPLPPYLRFPSEFAYIMLLAFSLFTLVATLSQCLCSESPYLSIELYRIYVC
jgi:hypothetical protein